MAPNLIRGDSVFHGVRTVYTYFGQIGSPCYPNMDQYAGKESCQNCGSGCRQLPELLRLMEYQESCSIVLWLSLTKKRRGGSSS